MIVVRNAISNMLKIKDYETCYKVSIIIIIVWIERQGLAYTFQKHHTTLLTMVFQKSII